MPLEDSMDITPGGAKRMSQVALECSDLLNQAVYDVRQTESEAVFLAYREAASKALVLLLEDVLNPVFEKYPELKPDGWK